MARNYTFTDGSETTRFSTEREAIWTFCEVLLDDSISDDQQYPPGTVLEVRHNDKPLLRYTVGYRPQSYSRINRKAG